MEKYLRYEEPKLVELDALLLQGLRGGGDENNRDFEDVSNAKFEAAYDEEDAEHETMEF